MTPILYEDVVLEKSGIKYDAEVVSHLSLSDWCLMKGYKFISSSGYIWAYKFDRTHIRPRKIFSGFYKLPTDIASLLKRTTV